MRRFLHVVSPFRFCSAVSRFGVVRLSSSTLLWPLLLLLVPASAHAHVGSKDVFEQIEAGPYKLFVTVRPPVVIPGVATLEVRSGGAAVKALTVTPVPMIGEASKHPPTPDAMKRSDADPQFFTGSLWLMGSGSWKVQFGIDGGAGPQTASVPVPAMPTAVLHMNRSLGLLLAALGLLLVIGIAGIVAAATRESRLAPGAVPSPSRKRRALIAGAVTLALVAMAVFFAGKWWDVEAADYANNVYRPSSLRATLQGDQLHLVFGRLEAGEGSHHSRFDRDLELLPDHGHLMHLYVIREPEMDAVFHLHPAQTAPGELQAELPAMPPGHYRLFADIVHRSGFPETLTARLDVPAGLKAVALDSEDAAATPPPLSAGELGTSYRLPDGYTMVWDRPATLVADRGYSFRFRLLDEAGQPARDMQPYLGMAGHAAFVKTDWSTFAHTHPEGSAAMPAMMLANGEEGMRMVDSQATGPLPPTVEFPYGFPSPGRYRIFIQMKHGSAVETGVFDADVR